jgi:cytoplasmic iron level regulating protein YaaA (DUF328/UPF0246 family)
MIALLSPSKKMRAEACGTGAATAPLFQGKTREIVEKLQQWSPDEIKAFMKVSDALAQENAQRYRQFSFPLEKHPDAVRALYLFDGDAYQGLNAPTLSPSTVAHAAKHLRILSGLYGVLRPTDLALAYRLEIGSGLSVAGEKNLYAFWTNTVTAHLEEALSSQAERSILNTASGEYSRVVNFKKLGARVVEPVFLELKDNKYRKISVFMKRARGLMVRFMVDNQIDQLDHLRAFQADGYSWDASLSTNDKWVYTR